MYFRDYMNDNPSIAKECEKPKLSLGKPYEHDRDGYTNAKTEFIKTYTNLAKQVYLGRYDNR
ncbi:GrpB family protein [Segatella cerevisiae]|uniref:GrpB family protein n=1 Tax=Segatella cerevisiae TaxID=2053716 RepID=UPI00374D426F